MKKNSYPPEKDIIHQAEISAGGGVMPEDVKQRLLNGALEIEDVDKISAELLHALMAESWGSFSQSFLSVATQPARTRRWVQGFFAKKVCEKKRSKASFVHRFKV